MSAAGPPSRRTAGRPGPPQATCPPAVVPRSPGRPESRRGNRCRDERTLPRAFISPGAIRTPLKPPASPSSQPLEAVPMASAAYSFNSRKSIAPDHPPRVPGSTHNPRLAGCRKTRIGLSICLDPPQVGELPNRLGVAAEVAPGQGSCGGRALGRRGGSRRERPGRRGAGRTGSRGPREDLVVAGGAAAPGGQDGPDHFGSRAGRPGAIIDPRPATPATPGTHG
jgi:hypothetical protein